MIRHEQNTENRQFIQRLRNLNLDENTQYSRKTPLNNLWYANSWLNTLITISGLMFWVASYNSRVTSNKSQVSVVWNLDCPITKMKNINSEQSMLCEHSAFPFLSCHTKIGSGIYYWRPLSKVWDTLNRLWATWCIDLVERIVSYLRRKLSINVRPRILSPTHCNGVELLSWGN